MKEFIALFTAPPVARRSVLSEQFHQATELTFHLCTSVHAEERAHA